MSGIECLHCYKTLAIPEWVNTDDYDGEIVCKKCKARLAIKFTGSEKPAKYKLIKKPQPEPKKLIFRDAKTDKIIDVDINRRFTNQD